MDDKEFQILAQILEDHHADIKAGRSLDIGYYIKKYGLEGELKDKVIRYLKDEEWMRETLKPITSQSLPDGFLESVKEDLDSRIRKMEDTYNQEIAIASVIYSSMVAIYILSRPLVRRGAGAAPSRNRLEHENEYFRWEIYQEGNSLIFSVVDKSKDYVGKYVTISVISAGEPDYRPESIQWKQEGPEKIGSDKPINSRGWIEFVIAETRLDMNIEEDFNLLQQVFQEIELGVFAEKNEGSG